MVTAQTIEVASLGMWDSLILMVMALVVFGPRRLPEIGRQIGKLMYEVRKASNDFKFQMEDELRKAEDEERKKKEDERLAALALSAPAATLVESQVPKSGPAAPVIDGQFPIPSPYPEEEVYPPVIDGVDSQVPNSVSGAPSGESYPRIMPPATGERVAASRPGDAAEPIEKRTEASKNEAAAAAEQAPHG
jgi:sec-independent protein translocase protein TatB